LEELRQIIAREMYRSPLFCAAVYSLIMDRAGWTQLANRELDLAAHQLRGSNSALFSAYDQERAEGEFRLGIAVPMATISAILVYLLRPGLFTSEGDWALDSVLASLTVGSIYYGLGYRKMGSANKFLLSAILTQDVEIVQTELNDTQRILISDDARALATGRASTKFADLRDRFVAWLSR
jgi:hypothetical protein